MSFIFLSSVLLSLNVLVSTSKILAVFPSPFISHHIVYRSLTVELARRGHDVVVMTPHPAFPQGGGPVNYKEIDVHNISYAIWMQHMEAVTGKETVEYKKVKPGMDLLRSIFEHQLKSSEVQELLGDESRTFDLVFAEACIRPTLALSHIFKAPVIELSSFGAFFGTVQAAGASSHPGLYPSLFRQKINNITIWEKVIEYYIYYYLEKLYVDIEELENELMKRILGSHVPSMTELGNNIQIFFLNTYPLWDFCRPAPPNVIYLGGLHENSGKMLPEELKNYLDLSTNGAIYMSFGTNIRPSLLPPEKIRIFVKVLGSLPYNVLWNWDKDELEGRPSNVRISKWFPQSDLLRHPNIKLFITQGGLQSTDEALSAGVPLIGIPMMGDQWFNTELYVHHKIGVKLSLGSLTEQVLENAIDTVLNDTRYRTNVIKLRTLMRDQPLSSLERAVRWTEHVLRHGGAQHLRAPAANMHWTQYYEIELVLIVFLVLVLLMVALIFSVKFTIKFLCRYKPKAIIKVKKYN